MLHLHLGKEGPSPWVSQEREDTGRMPRVSDVHEQEMHDELDWTPTPPSSTGLDGGGQGPKRNEDVRIQSRWDGSETGLHGSATLTTFGTQWNKEQGTIPPGLEME